ncbi:gliding motility protein GldM [Cytophagaceae bacterium ABcell3]|nr:gliding motility protein GldM [Cytophagaceae bacterium ABcell3]
MAGIKETPRQKLIGMMYLVLMALLALQVSSAILYKFQYLNDNLDSFKNEQLERNSLRLSEIREAVTQRGKRPEEVELAQTAQEVLENTREVLGFTSSLKKDLVEMTGGYDEEGNLKGASNETDVEVHMIGPNKNGKGYELKERVNSYIQYINEKTDGDFPPLALDGAQDPLLKNNPEQRNKDFSQLNFGQTPLVAAMAVITELESRVASVESSVLTGIYDQIGLNDFKFDKLSPMVRSSTMYVPAGQKYEADLFMTATSSSLKPDMFIDDNTVPVDENGIGKVSFTASGDNFNDNGIQKKVWTGKVKMKTPAGEDTVYTISEEYYVTKPVLDIKSGVVKSLYKNCGNKLNIQVPALGNTYNPSFSVTGGSVIKGNRKGEITIVPNAATVKLRVSSDGYDLGGEDYKVKMVPLPRVEILVNGKAVNPANGIQVGNFRNLAVKVIPDPSFEEALPDDAKYYISEGSVIHSRSRRPQSTVPLQSGTANLTAIANNAQANDMLVVEVKEIKRINFRNEVETVKMPAKTEVIPIY